MLIPLHAFITGDTLGLLLLVHAHERVATIAERALLAAASRIAPFEGATVTFRGNVLDPSLRIGEAGLTPLDRVDVTQPGRSASSEAWRAGSDDSASSEAWRAGSDQ